MKTVLLLSRGQRLSPIFADIARKLTGRCRIVAVLGSWSGAAAEHEIADWAGIDGVVRYDLLAEIKARVGGNLAERAADIEKEIGLPLYRSGSSYLLYRRFCKAYFGSWMGFYDTEQEMLEEFVGAHDLVMEIYDRYAPDLAFCEGPDLISHRVAQAVGHRRGTFTLGNAWNNLFGDGIAYFTYGCNRRNPRLEYYHRHPGEITQRGWDMANALIGRLANGGIHDAHYMQFHKKALSERPPLAARIVRNWRKLASLKFIPELFRSARVNKNRRWLEQNMIRELPRDPYIVVPLHFQPEASTAMVASRWVDQDRVVEQLAVNAPRGIRIIVKENAKGFGLRGETYFGPLTDLANVDLIHPTVSNDALLRNAAAIFAIAGTAGMEGIAMGKKVAILDRPSYDQYEGARRLNYPEEIFDHLADPAWRPEDMHDERRRFLAAMAESCFYLGRPQAHIPWPQAEEAGGNYADALLAFLDLQERSGLRPQDIPVRL